MSFGVSIGDFIALSKLVTDIVTALRSASRDDYKALVDELDNLQKTLTDIQNIKYTDHQRTEVEALKAAALSCKSQLDDFATKLAKFEGISKSHPGLSKSEKAKTFVRRLEWGFVMRDEVVQMKARIAAHVGYLNMRLMIITLSTTAIASSNFDDASNDFQIQLSEARDRLVQLQGAADTQKALLGEQKSYLQLIVDRISGVVPQITTLGQIGLGVWMTNLQIVGLLSKVSNILPSPDTRFTWAQAPVRFEDAFGRILPIPSEYAWDKVKAIVTQQFASGPGASKVLAGEYCVTAFDDPTSTFGDDVPLVPGSFLTMAMVIGIHSPFFYNICPRPGCLSRDFRPRPGGIKECKSCSVNFHIGPSKLERPFRFPDLEEFALEDGTSDNLEGSRKRRYSRLKSSQQRKPAQIASVLRSMRKQRRHYRHVRLTLGCAAPHSIFRSVDVPPPPSKRARPREKPLTSASPSRADDSSEDHQQLITPQQSIGALRRDESLFQSLIDIVADELALSREEVDIVGTPLQDLGEDSLSAIAIVFRIEDELSLDLQDFFWPNTQNCLAHLLDPLKY